MLVVGVNIDRDAYISGINNATLDEPAVLDSFVKKFTNFFALQDYVGNTYLCTTATFDGAKHTVVSTSTIEESEFVPGDAFTLLPITMVAKTEGGCIHFAGGRPVHGPKGGMH